MKTFMNFVVNAVVVACVIAMVIYLSGDINAKPDETPEYVGPPTILGLEHNSPLHIYTPEFSVSGEPKPIVLKTAIEANLHVCVPDAWDDFRIAAYGAEAVPPLGYRWRVVKTGGRGLTGDPERQPCEKILDHVHVLLERQD
jgi:hypothetical protein